MRAAILPQALLGAALVLSSAAAAPAGDKALGEYLASECASCHQLTGRFDGIPPIVGWPDETFVEVMNEYRHRKRPNAVMQTIAARLSDEELAALAAYFGSLTLQPNLR
ncbi:MAG TPA: c-type cytochrome [Salinarimonas sp.]|nr:c-type cytochrome [Salinarimonas sp.]